MTELEVEKVCRLVGEGRVGLALDHLPDKVTSLYVELL